MPASIEQQLIERLLVATGAIVQVSPGPIPDIGDIRALRPGMTVHQVHPGVPVEAALPGLKRIHLLAIDPVVMASGDTGGERPSVVAALRTSAALLRQRRVDLIRFRHGPLNRAAGESLSDLSSFLSSHGFELLKIHGNVVMRIGPGEAGNVPEEQTAGIYYAVSPRLQTLLRPGGPGDMTRMVPEQFRRFGLKARGVVHVGAHEGEELSLYKEMGFTRVLFVEANPQLATVLKERLAGDPSVTVAACAITNFDGEASLRIASFAQSSSILPMKAHRRIYPQITEGVQVTVPARRLDTLLAEMGANSAEFNYLHLDIQGAEYLALQGATGLLRQMDAVTTEINFEELYAGCALFDDLDAFITSHGFEAQVLNCAFHPSWGDAFYLRSSLSGGAASVPAAGRG